MNTAEGKIRVIAETDVVIAGGGLAGCVAAVSAARQGARAVLIDRGGPFGGRATNGLRSAFGCQHVDREARPILTGMQREIVERLAHRGAGLSRWSDPGACLVYDEQLLKLVLAEMLREAGVVAMSHTFASTPVVDEARNVTGLVVQNKTGREMIRAAAAIDATGAADVAFRAVCEMKTGPVTCELGLKIGNVDMDRLAEHVLSSAAKAAGCEVPAHFVANWRERGVFQCGISLAQGRVRWRISVHGLRGRGELVAHRAPVRVESLDPLVLSREQIRQQLETYDILKQLRGIPGFEGSSIVHQATQISVGPCRGIRGRSCLLETGQVDPAPLDRGSTIGTINTVIVDGVPAALAREIAVPFGVMEPTGVGHLIVANPRAVCCDPPGLLQSHSSAVMLGQAAGLAAAMAVTGRVEWSACGSAAAARLTESTGAVAARPGGA